VLRSFDAGLSESIPTLEEVRTKSVGCRVWKIITKIPDAVFTCM
jgi:hypothetical protein